MNLKIVILNFTISNSKKFDSVAEMEKLAINYFALQEWKEWFFLQEIPFYIFCTLFIDR